jgi:eukaryotic-like serine/threonine-protein kinase
LHAVQDELVRPAHADLAAPLAGGYATKSLATLRKRLGADYVVSGSYLVSGNAADAKVHLDLAMQDARTGAALASISQSGALSDLPAIVAKAGSGLREQAGFSPVSATEEKEIGKAQPPNIEVARHMGIALDALQKSDPARAKDELLQAISLAPGYAPAYVYLAQAWKVLGYDAKALAAVQQAAAFSDGLPVEQKLLIEREVSAQTADWPKALELDKKLLATDPKNPELQFNLIDDLVDAGKPAEAETALAETRKSSAMQGDPRIDLKAARIAFARGDSAAQAQHALLALQQAQARDEQAVLPKAKQNLSIALNALGKRDEAEKLTREAIDDYQRIGNPHGEADMRIMLAIIMEENGKLQAERDEYQHALEIYQRSGNQYGIAVTYQNLQRVLWNQGDHDGAEAAGKNALGIFREIGNLKGQVGVLAAMAAVQMDDGVTDSAMESLRQVIELSERIGDRVHLVDALNRYADGLRLRGSLIDAQEICSRAQLESKLTGDPFSAMVTVFTCASLTLDRGNVAVAATTFGNARSMAETLHDDSYVASADEILANIDMEQGNWQSASDRLKPAIATFAADDSVADEAAVQAMLALCNQKLDRPTERDAATKRARELRSRITRRLDSIVVDISLARLIGEMGDSRHAADLLKTLADDAEKGNWLGLALEARLIALRFLDQSHDPSTDQWRTQLESKARQHGFGWILARLALTRDSQHPRGR